MKKRLDVLLLDLGLVRSRQEAQQVIRAGWVQVNRTVIDKPGTEIAETSEIQIKEKSPFVSRGGEKLAGALAVFPVQLQNRICLDGGISTGGFTDCLLKNGVKQVYGIDVGYGQVAWEIRNDERVILKERTNLRYLKPEDLYRANDIMPDLAVLDLSFISLTKVLPALWDLLADPREVILLVKPQFEAGKQQVGKNGLIRDPKVRAEAILQVMSAAINLGWQFHGLTASPITGGRSGNHEYWLWLSTLPATLSVPNLAEIQGITSLGLIENGK